MKQLVTTSGFDGAIGVYMLDLQNGQEIHFALNQGQKLSITAGCGVYGLQHDQDPHPGILFYSARHRAGG